MTDTIKPPFPWFGGKRRVADVVWSRFGNVRNYVEPFFGGGAVLLGRPAALRSANNYETINDADGFVANFWRAAKYAPDDVEQWASWPNFENDLHARHIWLLGHKPTLAERLEGDPDFYDAKIAGWWLWGVNHWFGSPFCLGGGPWHSVDGIAVKIPPGDERRTNLGSSRQRPGIKHTPVYSIIALSDRLSTANVCSGDWSRVVTSSVTTRTAPPCGVFLDPPYADTAGRTESIYSTDSLSVAHDVRRWAIEHGDDERFRIALCGYDGEHEMPSTWEVYSWRSVSMLYGNKLDGDGRVNKSRERIWFSPHCLPRAVTP